MISPVSKAWKEWERRVAAYAQSLGLPWERRLRGGDNDDLLDIDGALPLGWLIGCKAVSRTGSIADRLSGAMEQCRRAMANLEKIDPGSAGDVIPVQIVQRQGYPVERAYAVMEYGYLLQLVQIRRDLEAALAEADR